MIVVALIDASDPGEIMTRVRAFEQAGCAAVLADGIKDLTLIAESRPAVSCPVFCNVIGGGKMRHCSRAELARQGLQGLIDSTPCLFAAQAAIEGALDGLADEGANFQGTLSGGWQFSQRNAKVEANLRWAGGP